MAGRFFEDLEIGEAFTTPSRTIFEADVVSFAALSGDHNEIHTNAELARSLGLPGPVPYVHLVMAMVAGLIHRLGLFEGTAVGFVGLNWQQLAPVAIGDTIHCRVRIADKRVDGADRGLVRREVEVVNQRGEVVQAGWHEFLLRRRAAS